MICPHCATDLPQEAMFCGECGRPVAAKTAAAAARTATIGSTRGEKSAKKLRVSAEPGNELIAPETDATPSKSAQAVAAATLTDVEVSAAEPAAPEAPDEVQPERLAEPEPEAEAQAESQPELCAQCGAALAATDIFCGECGFVRRGVGGRARPRDTVVLDPFPWGQPLEPMTPATNAVPDFPSAPTEVEPVVDEPADAAESLVPVFAEPVEPEVVAHVEPAPTEQEYADEGDLDETRIVDRDERGERFVLQFSTGESISVAGTGLVGRNPLAEPGEYFDALVTISDPGKSVSKTHLEFGQDSGAFWIADRFSGNGTVVREPERQPKRCDAGKRYRISRGTRVDIGEQFFIVS
ncbi:MAG: FHA domain-containing protein [Salinibacterium sp.]|nr:MAG: FHA domain-containing protein [Salinibacterium sp.]